MKLCEWRLREPTASLLVEADGGLISAGGNAITDQYASGASLQTGSKLDNPKGDGADTWFVGGSAEFGNNMLYAAYGQQDDSSEPKSDGVKSGYDSWNVVGVHSLSKRTKVYAGYAQLGPNDNDLDNIDWWTLGMKHTF